MGSVGHNTRNDDEISVVVTGFAPFRSIYPVNPSWEITKSLPEYLPSLNPKSSAKPASDRPVRIYTYPEPIHVNYNTVRDLVPPLWDDSDVSPTKGKKIDLMIHIGMAGPRLHYAVEQRAHRDGYGLPDVDDNLLDEDTNRKEGRYPWDDCPEELVTDLDLEDVLPRWKDFSPVRAWSGRG